MHGNNVIWPFSVQKGHSACGKSGCAEKWRKVFKNISSLSSIRFHGSSYTCISSRQRDTKHCWWNEQQLSSCWCESWFGHVMMDWCMYAQRKTRRSQAENWSLSWHYYKDNKAFDNVSCAHNVKNLETRLLQLSLCSESEEAGNNWSPWNALASIRARR